MLLPLTLLAASAASPGALPASEALSSATDPATVETPEPQRSAHRQARRVSSASSRVRLVTRDMVTLAADYFAPKKKGSRAPGSILVHDAGADRTQLEGLAEYLQKRGFGVLIVDLRGHGESATEEYAWDKLDEKDRGIAWSLAGRDLDAAAEFLEEKPEIHSAHLSLIGIGDGCSLVLRHAIEDANTQAVVLVGPDSEESIGFNLTDGVGDLEGLPCLIVAAKEHRKLAESMQTAGHEVNDDYEYVTVQVMKSKAEKLLEDRRLNSSLVGWLADIVMPKKR